MKTYTCLSALLLLLSASHATPLSVKAPRFAAEFESGALTSLKDADGNVFLTGGPLEQTLGIRRVGSDHWAEDDLPEATVGAGEPAAQTFRRFSDLDGASARLEYRIDEADGDLVLSQHCASPEPGVWGLEWNLGHIPLDMNIIIPGRSGIKLDRDAPYDTQTFDYPLAWEAQLVIIEGEGRGFYIWADDAVGRFKRLTVTRHDEGWQLGLATVNYAPFGELTECESVTWRLNTYEGDWRVPAARYREWMVENLRPTRVEDQKPAWVKDIRCVVIMGMDIPLIEDLTKRLDPEQTLLYIPGWRSAGYDRDYPVYDDVFEQFEPFVKRAHELGYRVMPHVNYFGVDPLNELYDQFEPFQCRNAFGTHDKLWWLWTRADPEIKFAYINPAHKPWRDLFVARMKEFCERYEIDALHLDQTLCIFNDNNGPIDGMSMVQGNVAIHEDLRKALPQVALSGEGLNEVTYRHEALAQRHAWGIQHSEGTWTRSMLERAHPIASYLLRPYTIIYGYLGCSAPTNGQLYAAWNEAYQWWGVIPTLKPNRATIDEPEGFSRQFFDEVKVWQEERLDPDIDGEWPAFAAFPYQTADGKRAWRTTDRRLLVGDAEVSRTISDVTEVTLPGTISGWRVYDSERIFGLKPESWYPYVGDARDMDAFHVESLPEGFRASMVLVDDDMAVIRTEQTGGIVADIPGIFRQAVCGSRPVNGDPFEAAGPMMAPDGAMFRPEGSVLHAHPPWKAPGSGVAYALFHVELPAEGDLRFVAEVAMDKGAVAEETDGVTYGVTARAGDQELHAELHNATAKREELVIDLAPFAGREVELELTVHPGPDDSPTFDWARWYEPRIEQALSADADLVVGGAQSWDLALSGTQAAAPRREGATHRVAATFPGAVVLTRGLEALPVELPFDVAAAPLRVSFAGEDGQSLKAPQFAGAVPGDDFTVGGVVKSGLHAHPPDRGMTVANMALAIPDEPAEFHSYVGIRDGSKSEGVVFSLQVNGTEVARRFMLPGEWQELTADLSPWAGKTALVSLVTDSDGTYSFDWAVWGEPVIRAK